MSSNENCEHCGEAVSYGMKLCRRCERKKFVGAAKSLFGHLVNDAKAVMARVKKARIDDGK